MKKYRQAKHTNWKKQENARSIILDLNTGRYYTLNVTASAVWELFQAAQTVHEVSAHIAKAFNAERDTVQQDVESFVQYLVENSMLDEVPLALVEPVDLENMPLASSPYSQPEITQHEAVKDITAGSGGYSYSVHYWYPN